MTIMELYIFLLPLIQVLGTVCLIVLAAGSVVVTFVWIIRRIWMYIVAAGLLTVFVVFMGLMLNVG